LCNVSDKSFGNDKAIYVIDNRVDAYRTSGAVRQAAQATAALIPADYLKQTDTGYAINHSTKLQDTGWCPNEPFAKQPVSSMCTAFLVDQDILVTAGHCMRQQGRAVPLDKYRVVFGFEMSDAQHAKTQFPSRDVYRIVEELEVETTFEKDWAVLKLDRAVSDRQVFEFAQEEIKQETPLTIFGYPNGLPLKVADGGKVLTNDPDKTVFLTDLDSYKGNSGSPVLNGAALRKGSFIVEGILVGGATDAQYQNGCKVSVTCKAANANNSGNYCVGESVTKINRAVAIDRGFDVDSTNTAPSNPESWNALPDDFKQLFSN
jgi:V8-like Glu-specific endopeptidase